jgi:hypothetical protein
MHTLTLEAIDYRGIVVGSDTFTVTSTHSDRPLEDFLRISEIMYHPAAATPEEIADGFTDAESFEFLELHNASTNRTLDLSGVRLVDGITFDFSTGDVTTLAPGEHVVVVENPAAFAARYGDAIPVAGQYAGRLSNSGERVSLIDGNSIPLHDFAFDDSWYAITDGMGQSLVPRNVSQDKSEWQTAAGWRPSIESTGSPGSKDALPGDFDGDHQIGLNDLAVLQARPATRDDVALFVLNYGRSYVPPAPPIAPSAPQATVVASAARSVSRGPGAALTATTPRRQSPAAVDRVFDEASSESPRQSSSATLRASRRSTAAVQSDWPS